MKTRAQLVTEIAHLDFQIGRTLYHSPHQLKIFRTLRAKLNKQLQKKREALNSQFQNQLRIRL